MTAKPKQKQSATEVTRILERAGFIARDANRVRWTEYKVGDVIVTVHRAKAAGVYQQAARGPRAFVSRIAADRVPESSFAGHDDIVIDVLHALQREGMECDAVRFAANVMRGELFVECEYERSVSL